MNEALIEIAKQVPLTAALIIAVRYLVKKNEKLEEENKHLNIIIREQQKDSIEAIRDNTEVMQTFIKYGKK